MNKIVNSEVAVEAAIRWALDPAEKPAPYPTVYLTVEDIARALRRSTKSVYRRIDAGLLTARFEGGRLLIHPGALRDYLRRLQKGVRHSA